MHPIRIFQKDEDDDTSSRHHSRLNITTPIDTQLISKSHQTSRQIGFNTLTDAIVNNYMSICDNIIKYADEINNINWNIYPVHTQKYITQIMAKMGNYYDII